MKPQWIFLMILLLFISPAMQSHPVKSYHDDYQQWFGLKVNYPASNHLQLGAQYVCRTQQLVSGFEGSYYYVQARYQFTTHWFPDLQFRVVDNHQNNLYRYEGGLQYRFRRQHFTIGVRSAYFNERKLLTSTRHLNDLPSESISMSPVNYWRNRINIRHKLPLHLMAYGSFEEYSQYKNQHLQIKRLACISGIEFNPGYHSILALEYLYQPDYHSDHNVHLQSVLLSYEYDIPSNKMKRELRQRFNEN